MTKEEMEELNGLAASMGLYEDRNPCKRAVILGKAIKELEQEPQTFKWCTNCKEYDQEKHCCHRWSNTIRDTVEEMKQEYIEREVLEKLRADIEAAYDELDGYDPDALGTFASKIDDLINNLLSDSEG